ncbi:MAG: polysaccharide deacetylase family protein [bacterium]
MSKKESLSRLIDKSGLLNLFLSVSRKLHKRKTVNILTYHRINRPGEIGPFDPSVIDADPEAFEKQVEFLKKHFTIITFSQLEDIAEKSLNRPAVIITFDDGYRDNYTHAFPILRRHGVPGVFFLSTGLIDNRDIFWWEKIHFFFLNTSKKSCAMEGGALSLTSERQRRESIREAISLLKRLPDEKRRREMASMEKELSVEIPLEIRDNFTLTWDEIREMSREGMEFGSHTVNHPLLSRLNDADLAFELSESRKRIQEEINKEADIFCYPVGLPFAYNSKSVAAVGRAGYRFATTVQYGANRLDALNSLELKRINVNLEDSLEAFKTTQTFPFLFNY